MQPTDAKDDFFKNGKPVHKTAYCAFLDVLGFTERIRESYKLGTHDSLLASFHSILGKAIVRLKEDSDGSMLYFKSFTDNVVLAHPNFSDDLESEFAFILWSLRELEVELLRKHKNNVVAELRKYRKNPCVFEKFAWLAAYHNHFCDQVADIPEYKVSLKVPGKEFSLVFSSISRK